MCQTFRRVVSMPDVFRVDGKVAIVTGASSGLGVAFAHALAERGAQVSLAGRRAERLHETRRDVEVIGGRCIATVTDVTDPRQCAELVARTATELGRVDILINNAGQGSVVPATRERPDEFRLVLDVNLMGTYWMTQECGRVMGPGSSIINIGSVLGLTTAGLPHAAYSSSKAAIVGLTRDLAQQWSGRKGIRVNCLAPGFFPTEMTDQYPPGYLDQTVSARVPMGRLGRLEECAAAMLFLASDAASYITGAVLPVDGGMLVT